ncbi:MAG: hypothetical protein AB1726_02095 [Planctomycetota bacterium]
MLRLVLLCLSLLLPAEDGARASDWITMGTDCRLVTAGDVNADGFADVVTINGPRDLCLAPAVHGWKSGPWAVLAPGIPAGEVALLGADLLPEAAGDEVAIVYLDHADLRSAFVDGRLTALHRVEAPAGVVLAAAAEAASG